MFAEAILVLALGVMAIRFGHVRLPYGEDKLVLDGGIKLQVHTSPKPMEAA